MRGILCYSSDVKHTIFNVNITNENKNKPYVIRYVQDNYSNYKYTLQYVHERKSKDAMEELDFLPNYIGTLIQDHNKVQYNFGTKHGECNSHILMYLQGVDDFTKHTWYKDMAELSKEILHQKNILKSNGFDFFK